MLPTPAQLRAFVIVVRTARFLCRATALQRETPLELRVAILSAPAAEYLHDVPVYASIESQGPPRAPEAVWRPLLELPGDGSDMATAKCTRDGHFLSVV